MIGAGTSFAERVTQNPCAACSAPCCRVVMIPHKTPETLTEIDYVRYLVNFPSIEVSVAATGDWTIVVHDTCRHFERETHRCGVHDTDEQPLTCRYYNQYRCWYKPNLTEQEPPDAYFLSAENFTRWAELLRFDDAGKLVAGPNFEESKKALAGGGSRLSAG